MSEWLKEHAWKPRPSVLAGNLQTFNLSKPASQWVPSGENLGHHLQVVDSKRLKFATHSVDRTAVGYGAAARLQVALCSGSLNRCSLLRNSSKRRSEL